MKKSSRLENGIRLVQGYTEAVRNNEAEVLEEIYDAKWMHLWATEYYSDNEEYVEAYNELLAELN